MKMREKTSKILLLGCLLVCICSLGIEGARAESEKIIPTEIYTKAGYASINYGAIEENDSSAITFYSNNSGDKNYYESYVINETGSPGRTQLSEYWNLDYDFSNRKTEVVAEKAEDEFSTNVHKKVIRVYDNYFDGTTNYYYWRNNWMTPKFAINESSVGEEGYIEFYFLSESTNGTFQAIFGDFNQRRYISAGSQTGSGSGICFGILPGLGSNDSAFFYSTNWTAEKVKIDNATYQPNKWYHVQLWFNNNSYWGININNETVYNSTTWTMDDGVDKFDSISFYTQTIASQSEHPTHVYYLDALGLSYNMSSHNENSEIDFNEEYEPYSNPNSINNLNDRAIAASVEIYFKFDLGNKTRSIKGSKLKFIGRFTAPVNFGKLLLYNRGTKSYNLFDDAFKTYVVRIDEYTFDQLEGGSIANDSINSTIYVGEEEKLTFKVEAEADSDFEYVLDMLYYEYPEDLSTIYLTFIVIGALGGVFLIVMYKISQKGGLRSSRRRRSSGRR